METCLTGVDVHRFAAWSINKSFNWKWEYLEKLVSTLALADVLIATFDSSKILAFQKFPADIVALAQVVQEAVRFPAFKGVVLVLQALCRGAARVAGWLEGCRCHEHLLRAGPGRPASYRSRLLEYRTASKNCVWGSRSEGSVGVCHNRVTTCCGGACVTVGCADSQRPSLGGRLS